MDVVQKRKVLGTYMRVSFEVITGKRTGRKVTFVPVEFCLDLNLFSPLIIELASDTTYKSRQISICNFTRRRIEDGNGRTVIVSINVYAYVGKSSNVVSRHAGENYK